MRHCCATAAPHSACTSMLSDLFGFLGLPSPNFYLPVPPNNQHPACNPLSRGWYLSIPKMIDFSAIHDVLFFVGETSIWMPVKQVDLDKIASTFNIDRPSLQFARRSQKGILYIAAPRLDGTMRTPW